MRRTASVVALVGVTLCAVFDTLAIGAQAQDRSAARPQSRPAKNPLAGDRQAITNGGAMFRNRCAGCHGPDARGYLGPDLTGLWSSGSTDDRIFDIVRRGIPGTEMPPADPQRVPDSDIWKVLAYVSTMTAVPASPPTGNAENGERIFRANCSSCHLVNGRGGLLGPDLSRIGSSRPRTGLLSKLRGNLDAIRPGFEPVTLVTREGERIRGVKKNEDEFSIQIMDTRERLQGFLKANLTELTNDKQSLMPVYGADRLNDQDVDDLLRYLTSLRGADAERRP